MAIYTAIMNGSISVGRWSLVYGADNDKEALRQAALKLTGIRPLWPALFDLTVFEIPDVADVDPYTGIARAGRRVGIVRPVEAEPLIKPEG